MCETCGVSFKTRGYAAGLLLLRWSSLANDSGAGEPPLWTFDEVLSSQRIEVCVVKYADLQQLFAAGLYICVCGVVEVCKIGKKCKVTP